jgi:PIN domain nuclease of toxin-antitoxin system
MRTFIVDTHALAWFVSRDPRLSDKARTILRDPNVRLIIPAIFNSSATQPRAGFPLV